MAFLTNEERRQITDKMNSLNMNAACMHCGKQTAVDSNLWGVPLKTDKVGAETVIEMIATLCPGCGSVKLFTHAAFLP